MKQYTQLITAIAEKLEKAHKRFEKLICGHLYIFDFHFLDTLHLPFLSQRLLALYQQFTHFWTCSL